MAETNPLKKFWDKLPIDRENPRESALDHMETLRELLALKNVWEQSAQDADEGFDQVWGAQYTLEVGRDPKTPATTIKARIDTMNNVMESRRAATFSKNMVNQIDAIIKAMNERRALIESLLYQDGQVSRASGVDVRVRK